MPLTDLSEETSGTLEEVSTGGVKRRRSLRASPGKAEDLAHHDAWVVNGLSQKMLLKLQNLIGFRQSITIEKCDKLVALATSGILSSAGSSKGISLKGLAQYNKRFGVSLGEIKKECASNTLCLHGVEQNPDEVLILDLEDAIKILNQEEEEEEETMPWASCQGHQDPQEAEVEDP